MSVCKTTPASDGSADSRVVAATGALDGSWPRDDVERRGIVASMDVIDWLLDSDPAIGWQVLRDLTDADPATVAAERARVAHEALGAEILARQDRDGSWHRANDPIWVPTLYTLALLRATGVDPADPAVASYRPGQAAGRRYVATRRQPCRDPRLRVRRVRR